MISYILKCAEPAWTEAYPRPVNWLRQHGEYVLWLASPEALAYPPVAAVNPQVVGGWDREGVTATQVDEIEYVAMRPLGNDPDGSATLALFPPWWQGFSQPQLNDGSYYPAAVAPLDVEARPHYFVDLEHPQVEGWGFRLELIGAAPSRDPTARAIGVYSDPGCTNFLWTTGAFVQGESLWQVDDNGDPLIVWLVDSWDGDRPAERKDWHIAMLLGATQEGHQTLDASQDSITFAFWDFIQGASGSTWVDSGSTWLALIGAHTMQVSDTTPFSAGQSIKIQDTEMAVTSVYTPGAPGILVVDLTLPQFTAGDQIYVSG